MELVTQIGIGTLVVAILLAWWRLAKGPSVLDRILAFDTITVCVVGLIVLLSLRWRSLYFLELILVVSMLGFLSGVAFVVYLDKTLDTHPDRGARDPSPTSQPDTPPKP